MVMVNITFLREYGMILMKRRIFASILAAVLCLTVLPVNGYAGNVARGNCGEALTWTLDDGGKLTVWGSGAMEDYSVDDPAPWQEYRSDIKAVIIGDQITAVGSYAFYGYSSVTEVTIGKSVARIGTEAFSGCRNLTRVVLLDSVKQIQVGAFFGCRKLESLMIPRTVRYIEDSAFEGCDALETLCFDGSREIWEKVSLGRGNFEGKTVMFHGDIQGESKDGIVEYRCGVCGKIWTKAESAPEHSWVAATCTEPETCGICGETRGEPLGHRWNFATCTAGKTCMICGAVSGAADGHDWQEADCENPRICKTCGASEGEPLGHRHKEEIVEATCTTPGMKHSVCIRCGDTFPAEILSEALGHRYEKVITPPTCAENGFTTYTCSRCGDSYVDQVTEKPEHVWNEGVVTLVPTGDAPGIRTYTCVSCGETRNESIPALVHEYGPGVVTRQATCTESGEITYTCALCGDSYTEELPAKGHDHQAVVTPPTCTEPGYTIYICSCGDNYRGHELPALGHSYLQTVTPATCAREGYTTHTCEACGYSYRDGQTEKLPHSFGEGVVTQEPTATEYGIKTFTCVECGAKRNEIISPIGEERKCDGGGSCPLHRFTDVTSAHWAHEGMDFAVYSGLMKGTGSGSTFQPDLTMSRAMLVTVLWRYCGSPEAPACDFSDVKPTDWYYKAVAWAASEGVVSGTGGGKFNPNGDVTREQLALILYRFAGNNGVDTSARADISGYPDGDSVASWSRDAVQWAVAEGIISGAKKGSQIYLAPQDSANRAVVATIMMRFIENVI